MTSEISLKPQTEVTGWRRVFRDAQELGVTAALVAMMLFPVAEAVLFQKKNHASASRAPR